MHWFYRGWTRSHKKKQQLGLANKKAIPASVFYGWSERVQAQSHWIHAVTVLSFDTEGDEA